MVVIRSARSSEQRQLADIGLAAWEKAVTEWGEDVDALRPETRQAYIAFTRESWPVILVAEFGAMPVGWGACENGRNIISDLWVLPEYQRQGAGSTLLQALEAATAGKGFNEIELSTHARNANAIALFKRRGYAVTSLSVRYSVSLDKDIETVSMKKELHQCQMDDSN